MNTIDISTATTAELVAFWNAHAEKPVKKFADRKTAERRVAALIEQMNSQPAVEELAPAAVEDVVAQDLAAAHLKAGRCPHCGGDESSQTGNGPEGTRKGDAENFCHECGGAYDRVTGAARKPYSEEPDAKRSAAIAASWQNPETAALRAARLAVKVNGEFYKSVPQAFRALQLPMSKHIAFRGALREAGSLGFNWDGKFYRFELVTGEE